MKLFYSPAACSMAVHIALNEAGVEFDLEKVDLATKKTESGQDFVAINPKGYVPALQLADGEYLTEVGAILQYVADSNPSSTLLPAMGDAARYRVLESVCYISAEIHKNFGPFFNPKLTDEARVEQVSLIGKRLSYVNDQLADQLYLVGDAFTIADAYLTTTLGWANFVKLDLSPWPNLVAFAERSMTRPSVISTLKNEGLM